MTKKMSASAMTPLPKEINKAAVVLVSALRNDTSGEDNPLPNSQSSQTYVGVQGDGLRVNFSPSTLQLAVYVDTNDSSGHGSQPVMQNMTPQMGEEMVAYTHGQATWANTLK
jgi:hypothetical protein